MARAIENFQAPSFFVRGPSPLARLVFFASLSLTLIVTDSRLHYLAEVRQGFMFIIHPLQVIANAPADIYQFTQTYFSSHHTLLASNRELKNTASQQGLSLQKLNTLEVENAHLRSLLGAKQSIRQTAKMAEILHMGRDPFSHKIIINIGTKQGVMSGQAVADGQGVIGQITRVYPFSSEVTLLTDKELAIPVQIERNGLRAIAFGHGRDTTIDLPYLPANVDIVEGDRLITSGIDEVYPLGLAVAEVSRIEHNPDSPFARIVCKPVAGIMNHRQLLVLSAPPKSPETKDTQESKADDKAASKNTKPTAGSNAEH